MRRLGIAVLGTAMMVFASVGSVAAAPAESANCIADVTHTFEPGTLGREISPVAPHGALGAFVGGQGSGAAPTNSCG
jgi:hypothetical protein